MVEPFIFNRVIDEKIIEYSGAIILSLPCFCRYTMYSGKKIVFFRLPEKLFPDLIFKEQKNEQK